MELNNAVALVTGGARGLGRSIAEAYAARGARLALVDILEDPLRSAAAEMKEAGAAVIALPADVTVAFQVDAVIDEVERQFGRVDILVNCAGTLAAIGPVWEVDPDKWLRDVLVSLYGSFLCSRAAIKGMLERRGGYILNMFGGGRVPQPYMSAYVSAKAGLLLLTESMAGEVEAFGVKVFAIRPGSVRTAMTESIINSPEGRKWRPDFQRIFDQSQDVNRDRVVSLALDLVSGQADALTGCLFDAERDFATTILNADTILEDDLLKLRLRE
jgi:NAD(P)-dependent dehydrogenase (short-subunit alcohol dehydrogenase family)